MTSRELCRRAIEFRKPERLPLSYGSCGQLDLVGVGYAPPSDWQPTRPGEDEWGAIWEHTDIPNLGQMKEHPIKEWSDLDGYRFPDPNPDSRYDPIEKMLAEPSLADKYVVAVATPVVFTLWERYYSLRGFDQGLMDFFMYPREAHDLLDRVLDFHVGIMANLKRRFHGRLDAFLVSDDWGTQTNTLLPVPVWREFFKNRYQRLCQAIHDAGMHALLHSDGRINDLLDDLIEAGFDGFNLHAPTVVGITEVGLRYAGKTAFLPCIDIQNTFVRGTVEDVRNEARLLLEYWGTPDGGIIPIEYGHEAVGAPFENVVAACQAFQELGLAHYGKGLPGR